MASITQTIKVETEGADQAAQQFKLIGDAAQKTGEQFGGLVDASAKITSTGATLADKFKSISDVFTKFSGKANEVADSLGKMGGTAGEAGTAIATVGQAAGTTASTIAGFGATVTEAAGTMAGMVKTATEAGSALTSLGTVLPGLSAAFATASAAIVTAITAVAAAVQRAVISILASLGPVGIAIAAVSVAAALYFRKLATDAENAATKAKAAFDKLVDEINKNSTKLSQAVTKAADDAAVAAEKVVQAQLKLQEAKLKEAQLSGDRDKAADAQQRIVDLTRQLAEMQNPLTVAIRERHAAEREAFAASEAAAKAALASNRELAAALRQTGEFKIDASNLKELDTTVLTIKGRLGEVKDAGGNVEEALKRIIRALPPDQAVSIGAKLGLSEAQVNEMRGNVGVIERLLKSLPQAMEIAAAGVDKATAATKQIWFDAWAAMAEAFAAFLDKIGAKTRSDEVKQWAESMRASAVAAGKDWEAANQKIADSYKPIATESTKAGNAAVKAVQTASTGYSPFFSSTEEATRRAKEWGDQSEKAGQKAEQTGLTAAKGSRAAAEGSRAAAAAVDEYKKALASIDEQINRLASSKDGKESLGLDLPRLEENARNAGQRMIDAFNAGLHVSAPELFAIISKNAELAQHAAERARAAVQGDDIAKVDIAKLQEDANVAAQAYIDAVKSGLMRWSPGAFQAIEEEADRAAKALAEATGRINVPTLDWKPLTLGSEKAAQKIYSDFANVRVEPPPPDWSNITQGARPAGEKIASDVTEPLRIATDRAEQAVVTAATTPAPNAWQWIVDTFTSIGASLTSGIDQATAAITALVTTPIGGAWQWIVDAWNAMLQKLGFGGGSSAAPADGGDSGFVGGGLLGGRGSGTSDSNLAWVSRGEHIMPAAAVRQPGVLAFLEALRHSGGNLRDILDGMGRFALGGLVAPTLSLPAFAGGGMNNVTINFPGLPEITGLRASSAVVDELRKAAAMAQVRSGGRKPSRYS